MSESKRILGVPWLSFWPNSNFLSWAADRLRIDRSAGWGAAAGSETINGENWAETANGFTDLEVWCFDFEWLETPDSEFLTMTLQSVHQMWPWGGTVDFDFILDNWLVACFSMLRFDISHSHLMRTTGTILSALLSLPSTKKGTRELTALERD